MRRRPERPRTSGFADHFSSAAAAYARRRPEYPDRLFAYLAGLAPSRGRVWDAGCGNGQASRGLARHFREVIATDASAEQIAKARPSPRITYRVAQAETACVPDGSIDLVTVAQAVHWFDRDRFWRRVRRALVPRGVIAIWCYELFRVDEPVDAVVLHFYRDIVGPYWPPERALVENGYRTIEFPFAETAAPRFEMRKRWRLEDVLGLFATWSSVNRFRDATGRDPIARIRRDLLRAWGPPDRVRTVRWSIDLRVGRKEGRTA